MSLRMDAVTIVERASARLESLLSRRSFINRAALVGSAVAVGKGMELLLEPGTAYARVCGCSGQSCGCGSKCCNGYTAFCCTVNDGSNFCPANTVIAGWWKADSSSYCDGGPRYYMDCNATCACDGGGGSFCGPGCDTTDCGCAEGDCDNWRSGCVQFRYGQCNQDIAPVGRIVCRMVTCAPPWEIDPSCTTTSARDNYTAEHIAPCWDDVRCHTPETRCQVVDMAATGSGQGYVIVTSFGRVFTYGDATHVGDLRDKEMASPIVAIAMVPQPTDPLALPGGGYYLVGARGGVFTFGSAQFFGSVADRPAAHPIVGMAVTPSGNGYWLASSNGGVFAFGDAGFYGSVADQPLLSPVVGIAATQSGSGYWLVARDGGVFTFGDAGFFGSASGQARAPVVGIAARPPSPDLPASSGGYWLATRDGGVFSFGEAEFVGASTARDQRGRFVAIGAPETEPGYWLLTDEGDVVEFGATDRGSPMEDAR